VLLWSSEVNLTLNLSRLAFTSNAEIEHLAHIVRFGLVKTMLY
jgi:hypothetical protein